VLRPDLGTMLQIALESDRQGFVGLRVLPPVEVPLQAGPFQRIKLEELMKNVDTKRASGAGYARNVFGFDQLTYATDDRGVEEVLDDRRVAQYANMIDAERYAAMLARDIVLRDQEKRTSALVFNTTTWTGAALTTAPATPWTTYASAVPITDVLNAKRKVFDGTGLWPNAVIMSRKKFQDAQMCTQVIDRIAAAGAGDRVKAADVTPSMLAQCFDVDQVIVAGSAKNTAAEGQARSVVETWASTMAMVAVVGQTENIEEPCIGRTFHWAEDGSQIGGLIEQYEETKVRGTIYRCRHDVQELIIYKELGHLLTSI
jgi:hypothetical protein